MILMNAVTLLKSEYDVIIIGGGWAGLTLARQLRRGSRNISILVVEANSKFRGKVGEATVEMAGHYFIKQLGMVNYLYRNHLPKNGLRFFYDNPDHSLTLAEMSEHGTTSIPPHPAFQLDRARLEADLVDMNRDNGIEVIMGIKATRLEIRQGDKRHSVELSTEDNEISVHARWLIDCSGRNRISRKHKKLTRLENVPKHFSAWGRFRNIQDIDSMGNEAWRKRAYGRFLSTNHFAGNGYWIWVIPLSGGYTSIGVVGEKEKFNCPPTKKENFLNFLMQYRAVSELLQGADIVDFEAWGQLAYRADEFIFAERWATSGFSAMFLDPLFSGGGDMIALFNDHITKYVLKDIGEVDRDKAQKILETELPIANRTAKEFFQGLYAHVANVYPIIDSAELCSPLLAYNTAAYFLEIVWDYISGSYLNQAYWQRKSYLRRGYMALELILQNQLLATVEIVKSEGRYYRKNSDGFFESGADYYKYFVYQMGINGRDGWRIDLRIKLWVEIFLTIVQVKLDLPLLANRMVVHNSILLSDILEKPTLNKKDEEWLFQKISEKLSEIISDQTNTKVRAFISADSFHTGVVNISDSSGCLSEDEQKNITKKAEAIWAQTQDYIARPGMVAVFLAFARSQPDSIMNAAIDQRKTQE